MTEQSSFIETEADVERAPTSYFFPRLGPFYLRVQPITYALLRISFALIILTHGIPKAFGTPHGSMADPMTGATNMIANVLHLPFPYALAVAAMLLETVGAIAVAAGFMTRFFAAALAVQMAVICVAHAPTFAWIDRGYEYPLMLGFVALHIAITGGGRYGADRWLSKQL
jgi:putative oxidoreductase